MRITFSYILILALLSLNGQIDPIDTGILPGLIDEASGLQCPDPIHCWTFNDSDDNARLYQISSSGLFLNQIIMQDALHIDYEDIARAEDGRYFIGDFGNNENVRTDLTIYITEDLELTSSSSIVIETLTFNLPDQTSFPPDNEDLNFDIESMIHLGDSLYLFSRNRTEPFNGWTKIYSLPDEAGDYEANLVDSIFGNLSDSYSSMTAADINPNGTRVALLTNGSLFLLTNFDNGLANADITYNFFSFTSSFEGISFIDDCSVHIVEEGDQAQLYTLNTCDLVSGLFESSIISGKLDYRIENSRLIIEGLKTFENVRLLDSLGRLVHSSYGPSHIQLSQLSSGLHVVQVINGNSFRSAKFSVF